TLVVVLAAPRLLRSDGEDGFYRPRANPDATPAPATGPTDEDAPLPAPVAPAASSDPDYDFYTLLPGQEVPMTDAELEASAQAEQERERREARQREQDAAQLAGADDAALPAPTADAGASTPAATASAAAPADTTARYLLQAGSFSASGDAEALKARIALLGLGARGRAGGHRRPRPPAGSPAQRLRGRRGAHGPDRPAGPRRAGGIGPGQRPHRVPGAHGPVWHGVGAGRCQGQARARRPGTAGDQGAVRFFPGEGALNMSPCFSRVLLCLGLAWAAPAIAALDCDAPDNWAQRTVCQSAALRDTQARLETLATDARQRSQDPDAFDLQQQQWADERRDACNTVRCLQTSYRSRMDELRLQIAGGRPPLLTPGTYHRHGAGAGAEDPATVALWI